MPTAYAIAALQYDRPRQDGTDSGQSGLRYSVHAEEILRFFARHRTALASHVRRYLLDLFSTDRDVRRHLRTLFDAGELNILTYNDPRHPNVYIITVQGLDHARDLTTEAIPVGRDDPKGDHILHEILITEVAVSRHEFIRSHSDFENLCPAAPARRCTLRRRPSATPLEHDRFSGAPRASGRTRRSPPAARSAEERFAWRASRIHILPSLDQFGEYLDGPFLSPDDQQFVADRFVVIHPRGSRSKSTSGSKVREKFVGGQRAER